MARKRYSDAGGGYNWMDTYGDMVTLLLTFFVMLFSMSSIDSNKWEMLVTAFSRGQQASSSEMQQVVMPGEGEETGKIIAAEGQYDLKVKEEIDLANERPISLSELYDYLQAYIAQNNMQGSVTLEKDAANNIYLRFDNNIFFNGDSSVLRQESYSILNFMGDCMKGVEDQIYIIRVIGHTAAVPVDNYPVNDWELSSERATRVINYFESNSGIDPTKLMANGYGKNHPRYSNDTAEGRAKNRRVEIMILGNEFDTGNADQLYQILQKMMAAEVMPDAANGSNVLAGDMPLAPASSQPDTALAQETETADTEDTSGASQTQQPAQP